MKTRCQSVQERLAAYSEDDLDSTEREAVEGHLAKCESCRRELTLIERAWESLDAWDSEGIKVSSMLRARVWDRLRNEKPPSMTFDKVLGWLLPRLAQGASGLVVCLLVMMALWTPRPAYSPQSQSDAQPQAAVTQTPLNVTSVSLNRLPTYELPPENSAYSAADGGLTVEITNMQLGQLSDGWMDASSDVLDRALEAARRQNHRRAHW